MDFSIKQFLYDKFDEQYRSIGFSCISIDEHMRWKEMIKKELSEISGINKMNGCPFDAQIVESENFDSFVREKIIINTQNNIKMPVYVLRPKTGCKKVVLALHGHGSNGKNSLVGIVDDALKERFEHVNYSYALDLVKMGFTVYVPDLCGAGERREEKESGCENVDKSSCNNLNFALISLGLSLVGIITYDLIRLLDYIQTDTGCKNVCCVGFSGGALSALWLSVFDARVDLTVASGYFHGFRDSILENNLCGCNFVPKLWQKLDCGDLGAAIAPRKLIVETGNKDELNGKRRLENVYPQIEIVKKAFKLYNKEDNFNFIICDGDHKWYGSAYDLIKKWGENID